MKKQISPVTAVIIIVVAVIVALGLGWKLFFAGPTEPAGKGGEAPPPPPGYANPANPMAGPPVR